MGATPIQNSAQFLAATPQRRFRTLRTLAALVLREMVTTYGRSPGGYLWAVLEPVAAIALLSFAFSLAFHSPSLGASFPLFYASGYLPYMLFHDVTARTATAIRFSLPLLSFGALTYLDVLLARFALNLVTHLATGTLLLGVMVCLLDTRAAPDLGTIALAAAMVAALAAGAGLLNAYLFLAYPAYERIWMVMTRPLFIVSGVFFLFEDVPHEYRDWLWFNPLFHVTGVMRRGLYPTYEASYAVPAYAFGIGAGLALLGLLLLGRHANALIHK